MHTNFYYQFISSLKWNTIESISYHLILFTHQLLLFKVITHADYGMIGALFSAAYLLVAGINLGLDASLGVFFFQWSASKKHFQHYISRNCMPTLIAYIGMCTLLWYVHNATKHINTIEKSTLLIILGLIGFESIKKTSKHILHIVFKNRITAIAEIAAILIFVSIVWLGYFFNVPINAHHIFTAMLISSVVSTSLLMHALFLWYGTLPTHNTKHLAVPPSTSATKNRSFIYLNELSNACFSSNFLVPLFAITFGLTTAGMLKITSSAVHTVTLVLRKIFSPASEALFANTKNDTKAVHATQFFMTTRLLTHIFYAIVIFLTINYKLFLKTSTATFGQASTFALILYFTISFTEIITMVYEKFITTQEQAIYICGINLVVIGTTIAMLYAGSHALPINLLIGVTSIRVATLVVLSAVGFYRWRIKPSWRMSYTYFLSTIFFSYLFLLATVISG